MTNGKHRLRALRPLVIGCVVTIGALAASFPLLTADPPLNVPFPTLGGKQVWADEFFHAGWRIQKNVLSGRYRLLDGHDVRRAWGTYEQCRAAFDAVRRTTHPHYRGRHLVILIHGLGRSGGMFADLADSLRADGLETAAISYASTRDGIEAHAGHLARLIAGLEEIDEVSFVTYSLGGLVVRALFARPEMEETGIRFRRLVMIAPPSHGSAIARTLRGVAAHRWLTTETGQDLTPEGAEVFPVPPIEFAIVAGGLGDGSGFNPLLDGDDDGVVAVDEARLDGARDFLVDPSPHGLIDNHPETIRAARAFLRHGHFGPPRS